MLEFKEGKESKHEFKMTDILEVKEEESLSTPEFKLIDWQNSESTTQFTSMDLATPNFR
jgi:hypothetical protein